MHNSDYELGQVELNFCFQLIINKKIMLYPDTNEEKSHSEQINCKSDLLNKLSGIITILDDIFNVSEKQFNLISEKLQHFYHSSKEITKTAAKVTGLLTSDEYSLRINELDILFQHVRDYLNESSSQFNTSQKSLIEITKLLLSSAEGVTGFNKICRHLEMQSISIKIESSRLGNDDKGFSHLSDDIHKLAELISKQSNGFRDKAKSLISTTTAVENQVVSLITNQEENSKYILKNTRESLNLLSEEFELSSKKASSISAKTENIQKRTGNLVTSIQFHDITRQQMEHVEQVIKDLSGKIVKKLQDEDLQCEPQFLAFIHNVCQLQSAQMNNSRNELFNAVNDIISGHDIISGEISGVSNDTLSLFNNSDKVDNSFIQKVKNGFDSVVNTLVKNEVVKKDFTGSVDNVISTIEELSQFVNEINGIGSEIELLALNANIKAAHTGPEGASLGVLAEAIQRLSSDSRNHTNTVIDILVNTQDVSSELKTFGSTSNSTRLISFSNNIKEIFDSLNSLSEEGFSSIKYIQKASADLQKEIRDSASTLKEYLSLKKQIERIVRSLDSIVKYTSAYANVEFDRSLLTEIGIKYTMQVQRDIHNNIINDGIESEPEEKELNLNNNDTITELGDNIELF
jgi:methyl-accepting chemotaxis protein